jgi:drug/metabolite transporter (DMT)-like permease
MSVQKRVEFQASVVIALTIFWYLSLGIALHVTQRNLSEFWFAFFSYLSPAIILGFIGFLWQSHVHSERAHRWLVIIATLLGISPAILSAAACVLRQIF